MTERAEKLCCWGVLLILCATFCASLYCRNADNWVEDSAKLSIQEWARQNGQTIHLPVSGNDD